MTLRECRAAENLSLETYQLSFGAQSDEQLLQRQNVSKWKFNDTFFGCLETKEYFRCAQRRKH